MKKYNNIIVPTDGSVNSKRALEHAVVTMMLLYFFI